MWNRYQPVTATWSKVTTPELTVIPTAVDAATLPAGVRAVSGRNDCCHSRPIRSLQRGERDQDPEPSAFPGGGPLKAPLVRILRIGSWPVPAFAAILTPDSRRCRRASDSPAAPPPPRFNVFHQGRFVYRDACRLLLTEQEFRYFLRGRHRRMPAPLEHSNSGYDYPQAQILDDSIEIAPVQRFIRTGRAEST
jgi:hypothetical protein